MSNLYEINAELEQLWAKCFDEETGEIDETLYDEFNNLQLARDEKIENIACWIKNLRADADAFKKEKEAFYTREKAAKNKAESLTRYISSVLNGEKFSTSRVSISFSKSSAVECPDISSVPTEYLKFAVPSLDKMAVKQAFKQGTDVEGCYLVEKQNIQIK